MHRQRFPNAMFHAALRPDSAALAIMLTLLFLLFLLLFLILTPQPVQAQTFNVLYNFTSGPAGGVPGGLLIDRGGNLYGTTVDDSGNCGGTPCGTVFRLSKKGSGWVLTTLHSFTGNADGDGAVPTGLVFGPDGSLYGTTEFGGGTPQTCGGGCGTIFKLRPPATACLTALCGWSETVLYRFRGSDGYEPLGSLTFDPSGNLYGTALYGGTGTCPSGGCGLVWKLSPSPAGWTQSVLHNFGGDDGASPIAGVTVDPSGNLYGTTTGGGAYGYGTVFQLTPSGSGWTLNTLYAFQGGSDGYPPFPYSTLIFDTSKNLYGATSTGGSHNGGTVFELTPANGNWTFNEVYGFAGPSYPFSGPDGNLFMDKSGNLYGVTKREGGTGCGGYGCGTVFKLTPGGSGWTYTLLHAFSADDGSYPNGNLVFDVSGNLYGTTAYGGANGRGVLFEITP